MAAVGEFGIMSDEHKRDAFAVDEIKEQVHDLAAGSFIEIAAGFVRQKNRWAIKPSRGRSPRVGILRR
jgi:hypothetical protein